MRALKIESLEGLISYDIALAKQKGEIEGILSSSDHPYVLTFLEHQPVFTLGRSYDEAHLLISREEMEKRGVDVHEVSRGGSVTYHGPGQLVAYLHVHLKELKVSLTAYLRDLEQWVIDGLGSLNIEGWRAPGKTGVWTERGKICAMGVSAKKYATYHGIGLNFGVDKSIFSWVVPCGLAEPVASMDEWGKDVSRKRIEEALLQHLPPWLKNCPRLEG